MALIRITSRISLDEAELDERFIQASGPGGQNVNKVATAVQLRFDAARSPALSEAVRRRLATLAGRRMTQDGVLVLTARAHRTQERNRAEARARLVELIAEAAVAPVIRRATRPTLGSKERRLAAKDQRGRVKQTRGRVSGE